MISKQWMMQIRKFCALQNPHSMRLVAKKQVSVSHIFANIITGYNPSDLNRDLDHHGNITHNEVKALSAKTKSKNPLITCAKKLCL